MERDELYAAIEAQRAGGSRDALKSFLDVQSGPDAGLQWAVASLAEVIVGHPSRIDPLPEPELVAVAPPAVRVLLAAAAHHVCADVYLGNFQLRALDEQVAGHPDEQGAGYYQGMTNWGGRSGKRVRIKKAGMRIAVGPTEAFLAWSPKRAGSTLATYTAPLAGVHDSERQDCHFAGISAWILEMLDQNTIEFEPSEMGRMHPTYKSRGQVNALEEVCARLGSAMDEEEWF